MVKRIRTPWEKDLNHVIHPYTNFIDFKNEGSTIFTHAFGHYVEDIDKNRYLDGIAGLWCVNIGHGHKELIDFMSQQAMQLSYYNTFENSSSIPAANLAAKLAELTPGNLNHSFFGTGGSVANDTAIKLIHYYFNLLGLPNKKKVISHDLGYHGSTYLSHTLTGIKHTHEGFDLAPGLVHYLKAPYYYRNGNGLSEREFCNSLIIEMEKKIQEIGPENIACFIAEPILGAGGVIVPPEGYQSRCWHLCKKYDILYISDEVVTAFGRVGYMITSKEKFGINPDIIVMAKGISSGYIPLGATIISDEIYNVISIPKKNNPVFSHGFTYSGHPLSCAVGYKNIEILERDMYCEHVMKWGPYFEQELKKLSEYEIVGDIRGSHFMMCLELVKNKKSKQQFASSINIAKKVYNHCKKRGLIIRPISPLCVLSPPLTYDKEAIDETVSILMKSLEATIEELKNENLL